MRRSRRKTSNTGKVLVVNGSAVRIGGTYYRAHRDTAPPDTLLPGPGDTEQRMAALRSDFMADRIDTLDYILGMEAVSNPSPVPNPSPADEPICPACRAGDSFAQRASMSGLPMAKRCTYSRDRAVSVHRVTAARSCSCGE